MSKLTSAHPPRRCVASDNLSVLQDRCDRLEYRKDNPSDTMVKDATPAKQTKTQSRTAGWADEGRPNASTSTNTSATGRGSTDRGGMARRPNRASTMVEGTPEREIVERIESFIREVHDKLEIKCVLEEVLSKVEEQAECKRLCDDAGAATDAAAEAAEPATMEVDAEATPPSAPDGTSSSHEQAADGATAGAAIKLINDVKKLKFNSINNSINVAPLKEQLEARGLSTDGKKEELFARLQEAVSAAAGPITLIEDW